MAKANDFPAVFERLRDLFRAVEGGLLVVRDAPGDFYANAPHPPQGRSEMFFGAATIKKRYVSFYLSRSTSTRNCSTASPTSSRSGCRASPASTLR